MIEYGILVTDMGVIRISDQNRLLFTIRWGVLQNIIIKMKAKRSNKENGYDEDRNRKQ